MQKKIKIVETTPQAALNEDAQGTEFPLPDFLRNISPALAARQILWAGAILGCLAGMFFAIAATASAWIALGSMHEAAVVPLGHISQSVYDLSATVGNAQGGLSHFQAASANISSSLRGFASSTGGISSSLSGLSSIPGIGGGFGESLGQLAQSSKKMEEAADEIDAMSSDLNGSIGSTLALRADLNEAAKSIADARGSLASAFGWLQIGVALFGIALCALFSSTLSLALSFGFPKK